MGGGDQYEEEKHVDSVIHFFITLVYYKWNNFEVMVALIYLSIQQTSKTRKQYCMQTVLFLVINLQ